ERKRQKEREESWATVEARAALNSATSTTSLATNNGPATAPVIAPAADPNISITPSAVGAVSTPLAAAFAPAAAAAAATGLFSRNEVDSKEDLPDDDVLVTELTQADAAALTTPAAPRFRRKSVLPVDEHVLSELSRHRPLVDLLDALTAPDANTNHDVVPDDVDSDPDTEPDGAVPYRKMTVP
ncbi:hypothetical protein HK405_007245, partial [Cladochytrium tenue]